MNTESSTPCRAVVEVLEIRKLLSTVNVTDFGAVPNDGHNDSAAVQAAIDHSSDGDTIYFPAGTYNFETELNPAGNRNYVGANRVILKSNDTTHVFHVRQDNIHIENFTFVGDPITIDKGDGSMVENLVINGNDFQVSASGQNCNGITFNTGLRNSSITNNSFGPINADNGIYGYYWDNLTIANNQFLNGNEGIHLTDFGSVSKNLLIEQNYFSGLHRMGIELQGGGHDAIIQDNFYENPAMSSDFHANDSTFAYSIIDDQSEGNIIRRNTALTLARPDGVGVRIGFEVGGDNTLVTENYVVGTNAVLAATDGLGSASILAKNNRWGAYLQGAGGIGLTLENNGHDVHLDWDPNRGRPGPFKRLTLDGVKIIAKSDDPLLQSVTSTAPKYDPNAMVYLSDLQWASATSSWGPAELDQTNGHDAENDGSTIKLDGKKYDKGLGVAGDSQIVYNLDGEYSRFFSDVGIDDSAGKDGSVKFEVIADGKIIFDSGLVTGDSAKQGINIDVSDVKQLKLVTTDGGDGIQSDLADWASARVLPIDFSRV